MKKKTHEEFIEELTLINQNVRITTNYTTSHDHVSYKCVVCNYDGKMTPSNLLRGKSCPICAKLRIKKTHEEFINEITIINPNIEIIGQYIGSNDVIKYKCLRCNEIQSSCASSLLQGHDCPNCFDYGKTNCATCGVEIIKHTNKRKYCDSCAVIATKQRRQSTKYKERLKQYKIDNKEEIIEQNKIYYEKNKETIRAKRKEYRSRPDVKKYMNKQNILKQQTDLNYKITCKLRKMICGIIRARGVIKSAHTLELIGSTIDELIQHLQLTALFNGYDDFDINNYSGKEYHIDHIIPCSAFNLKCSYHQKLCFHYSNLQILTAKENLSKSNKIPE